MNKQFKNDLNLNLGNKILLLNPHLPQPESPLLEYLPKDSHKCKFQKIYTKPLNQGLYNFQKKLRKTKPPNKYKYKGSKMFKSIWNKMLEQNKIWHLFNKTTKI